jgi:succinate dehydrogenase flavin-adding protein (antitoxin of CptAB toxin-antitoxin module)
MYRLLNVKYKKGTRLVHLVLEYLDCDLHDYILDAERFDSSINDPMIKKVNKVYRTYFVVIFCN